MNIYIPIEIKVRELEGRTLLAIAAAERGHTVILGEKKDTIGLAKKGVLPPGLIHMKSITPHDNMIQTLNALKSHGHKITVQDEESGLLDESYDTFARLRFSEETIPLVDRICTWGRYDERSLKEMYKNWVNKFSVTGSPRVDFWRKDFAEYYKTTTEAGLLNGKPYFMIVSNFGGPLNVNPFWNIMARLNNAGYFEREVGRERHEFDNMAYQTKLIGEFIFMIRELAVAYPNHHILVRPHPVESVDGWKKLIGDVPGVYVNRDGTISRWIRNAKVIIHNGCTSALEASIAGENRIAYRPIPDKIEREIPNKVSLNAYSMAELKALINGFLNGRNLHESDPDRQQIEEILKDRFAGIDGILAADRVVTVWDEIAAAYDMQSIEPEELIQLKSPQKKSSISRILKKIGSASRRLNVKGRPEKKNEKLLKSSFKFPEFTDMEFERIYVNLARTLNRFNDVTCKRFGQKSFLLFKK
jgi:surface carbohydrate biosynthesis protein